MRINEGTYQNICRIQCAWERIRQMLCKEKMLLTMEHWDLVQEMTDKVDYAKGRCNAPCNLIEVDDEG